MQSEGKEANARPRPGLETATISVLGADYKCTTQPNQCGSDTMVMKDFDTENITRIAKLP